MEFLQSVNAMQLEVTLNWVSVWMRKSKKPEFLHFKIKKFDKSGLSAFLEVVESWATIGDMGWNHGSGEPSASNGNIMQLHVGPPVNAKLKRMYTELTLMHHASKEAGVWRFWCRRIKTLQHHFATLWAYYTVKCNFNLFVSFFDKLCSCTASIVPACQLLATDSDGAALSYVSAEHYRLASQADFAHPVRQGRIQVSGMSWKPVSQFVCQPTYIGKFSLGYFL